MILAIAAASLLAVSYAAVFGAGVLYARITIPWLVDRRQRNVAVVAPLGAGLVALIVAAYAFA